MGNKTIQSLESFHQSKKLTLEMFKKTLPRKMTIHILSNNIKDCIKLVEFFTNEKIKNFELLEENIKKKVNLFSFMNYKIYGDADLLNKEIKERADNAYYKPLNSIFSEVIIILDNEKLN